jgi:hypothetical protein
MREKNIIMVDDVRAAIENLTVLEILHCLRGVLSFSVAERNKKALLVERTILQAPVDKLEELKVAGLRKGEEIVEHRKRKRRTTQNHYRTKRRRVEVDSAVGVEEYDVGDNPAFLQLPTEEETKNCYRKFFEATSNEALSSAVCGICARECGVMDEKLVSFKLADIPNMDRLIPDVQHPAHDLFEGKLLASEGVFGQEELIMVNICSLCLGHLRNTAKSGPPRLALANGLWIGRVPWQLQVLTFAEQLLVALLYPRVYVFKLFPKKIAGTRNTENLQRGMRGNVCTYELNSHGILSMLHGDLMPRPPSILASLISVTFIGVGQLPRSWMGKMFRVRRHAIFEALAWLKANNPRYYGNVEIDEGRLAQLPEDEVPDEILSIVRQSTDEGMVDQESDGYIPQEDELVVDEGSEGAGSSGDGLLEGVFYALLCYSMAESYNSTQRQT